MSLKIPISQHLIHIKYRVLKSLLLTTFIAMNLVALINLFNQRPIINVVIPIGASIVMLLFYWLTSKIKYRRAIKLTYMLFLVILYLPLAWLTSPGSFSAMPFYAILIIFIGLILSEHTAEYLIPLTGVVEMLYLFHYETLHPEQYNLYVPMTIRAFDLSINFVMATAIFFVISLTLNRHFDDEHQRLFKISIMDQLTKVYNRRYLFQQLDEVHYVASKTGMPFSLVMIDINHFKQVNDTYGHSVGDEVLIQLGSILISSCRRQDVPARFGGDEFILLLQDTAYAEACHVAERITAAFQPIAEKYADTKVSLGIGIVENHHMSISEMIQQVDDHLYKNKREMKQHEK